MGITRFPHGISSMGIQLPSGDAVPTGNIFWVSSAAMGGDNGWSAGVDSASSGTRENPFATIDYAIGKCTANAGDIIYVLPNHTCTVSAAGSVTCDVAGVSIIGLGNRTNRPVIDFTATTSTLLVTAANVTIKNMQFTNSIDSLVSGVVVSAASCTIDNCAFTSPTATNDALIWILTAAGSTDMVISNSIFRTNHAGPTHCIKLVGSDRIQIVNNQFYASASTAVIESVTTVSTEMFIGYNTINNSVVDIPVIKTMNASTGRIVYNNGTVVSTAGITDANIIALGTTNCQLAQNYFSDASGETGKLVGVVSA